MMYVVFDNRGNANRLALRPYGVGNWVGLSVVLLDAVTATVRGRRKN